MSRIIRVKAGPGGTRAAPLTPLRTAVRLPVALGGPRARSGRLFENYVDSLEERAHGRLAVASEPARQFGHGHLQPACEVGSAAEKVRGANQRCSVSIALFAHDARSYQCSASASVTAFAKNGVVEGSSAAGRADFPGASGAGLGARSTNGVPGG